MAADRRSQMRWSCGTTRDQSAFAPGAIVLGAAVRTDRRSLIPCADQPRDEI